MTPSQLKAGDWVGPFKYRGMYHGDYYFYQSIGPTVGLSAPTVQSLLTHYGGVSVSEGGEVKTR